MEEDIRTVHDLLRMNKADLHLHEAASFSASNAAPQNLNKSSALQSIEEGEFTPKALAKRSVDAPAKAEKKLAFLQRDYVKYPVIFVFAFAFFYFFLNFGAFSNKLVAYFNKEEPKSQTEGTVLGVSTPDYDAWIKKYFYQANNADALSPNADYDADGLTNYQEFLLGTNPTKKDTDGDGYNDGQEILNGYNPLYDGKLTAEQQEIIKDWDLSDINNRISYAARLALSSQNPSINPLARVSAGPSSPSQAPIISYDLSAPGQIYIPKLNVKAPIIWSQSPDNFSKDLESGAIHYPGTSLPGQNGVSYISGHSSSYVWNKSKYSYIFSRINELSAGDEFFVTVGKTDGKTISLRYVVTGKKEYKPDDQAQFTDGEGESVVNLSTCWPLGSTARRIVVSGKMTGL